MLAVANVPIALVLCGALVAPDGSSSLPSPSSPEGAAESEVGSSESPARRSFLRGRELYLAGDYAAAIAAFETAYDLSGDRNLLYNIALAYDRGGDLERAIHYFERYRDLSPAEDRAEIEVRLAGLRQRLDAVSSTAANEAARTSRGPSVAREAGPDESSSSPRERPREPGSIIPAGHVALAVLAAASLAVATGLGTASRMASRDAARWCEGLCREAAEPHLQRARSFAIGADVTFVFGGTAAAAFVTLLAIDVHRARRSRRRISPGPKASPS